MSATGAGAGACGAVACGDRVRTSTFSLGCEDGVLDGTGTTGAAATGAGGLPRLTGTWEAEGSMAGGAWLGTNWCGGMCDCGWGYRCWGGTPCPTWFIGLVLKPPRPGGSDRLSRTSESKTPKMILE